MPRHVVAEVQVVKHEIKCNDDELPQTLISSLYKFYLLVHESHRIDSAVWSVAHCNKVLTSVMTCQPFAWQVIGITKTALARLQETDFRRVAGCGVVRGHIVPRIDTVRKLVSASTPLPAQEFITLWIKNDKTVFCLKSENKIELPSFLQFDSDALGLFKCTSVAWKHGKEERDYLRSLASKHLT